MARNGISAYLRYVVMCLVTFFAVTATAEPNFPTPVGFVTDTAGLINPPERTTLESELKSLEKDTTWEFWVVTVPSLEGDTIERYAQDFFVKNGIGKKGKDNGVLLLLARQERKVRIHTGFHAESVIPDAIAKRIISLRIAPKTKADDWTGGLLDGSHEIIRIIRNEHAHPGQAVEVAPQHELIMGMEPGIFWFLLIVLGLAFLWFLIKIGFFGPGGYSSDSGGYYSSGGGGGGFSGGGGDCGGGGASGDC